MEYIATFFTHSGAIKFQRWLKAEADIEVELRPVPRQLSSSCGVAGTFSHHGDVSLCISEDLERLFRIGETGYELVHENN